MKVIPILRTNRAYSNQNRTNSNINYATNIQQKNDQVSFGNISGTVENLLRRVSPDQLPGTFKTEGAVAKQLLEELFPEIYVKTKGGSTFYRFADRHARFFEPKKTGRERINNSLITHIIFPPIEGDITPEFIKDLAINVPKQGHPSDFGFATALPKQILPNVEKITLISRDKGYYTLSIPTDDRVKTSALMLFDKHPLLWAPDEKTPIEDLLTVDGRNYKADAAFRKDHDLPDPKDSNYLTRLMQRTMQTISNRNPRYKDFGLEIGSLKTFSIQP